MFCVNVFVAKELADALAAALSVAARYGSVWLLYACEPAAHSHLTCVVVQFRHSASADRALGQMYTVPGVPWGEQRVISPSHRRSVSVASGAVPAHIVARAPLPLGGFHSLHWPHHPPLIINVIQNFSPQHLQPAQEHREQEEEEQRRRERERDRDRELEELWEREREEREEREKKEQAEQERREQEEQEERQRREQAEQERREQEEQEELQRREQAEQERREQEKRLTAFTKNARELLNSKQLCAAQVIRLLAETNDALSLEKCDDETLKLHANLWVRSSRVATRDERAALRRLLPSPDHLKAARKRCAEMGNGAASLHRQKTDAAAPARRKKK